MVCNCGWYTNSANDFSLAIKKDRSGPFLLLAFGQEIYFASAAKVAKQ